MPESGKHRLEEDRLRWRCDPARFSFETLEELGECPINIIGQPRAEAALRLGLERRAVGYNIFVTGRVGSGRSTVVRRMLATHHGTGESPEDLGYVHNFRDPDQPGLIRLPSGEGRAFTEAMEELVEQLGKDLRDMFESETYRKRRSEQVEAATADQKAKFKEFEKRVQEQGFSLVQVQMGPFVRSQVVPVVAGNPVEMDQLESLVEQGQFKAEDFQDLRDREAQLRGELEGLGKEVHGLDRRLRRELRTMDRELASPLVEDALREIRERFPSDIVGAYLSELTQDVLDHIDAFREPDPSPAAADADEHARPGFDLRRYSVNLLSEGADTSGRPVIWETNPSYRNLFGTIEQKRVDNGQWETDHTRIKAGSLIRANGGFLVIDALDALVEPGVWAALKRTLRHRKVEIQSFEPVFAFSGISLKPEPIPIDVKVVMIGTPQIYARLFALDEDFKKIFKVKAEFASSTALEEEELRNYSCLIHKRCREEQLPTFHRDAVAAIVEHGVRLAEHRNKLTTRFTEVTDVVREAAYWATQDGEEVVRDRHVDRALEARVHRVDLIEELLRERITEGTILMDLEGAKVGQVNGLAVLDAGDHVFAQPTRITATTAMGRAGIINIDREADMSGAIHTKGVLILTGFLRARFAQNKPLTLTASLCFEQNYGGVDGDSASSTELYALLSSLGGVPIQQGIAVTGSVNQHGEIQPIGGVNEKIEGYFDLCRATGLTGRQGVMIPRRNLHQLMLRKDVVAACAEGQFHVWAVDTIEQGLEVLTAQAAGSPDNDGNYPADSILGRVDARLRQLARDVTAFGVADGSR